MSSEKHYKTGSTCPPLIPGKLRLYSMRFCPYAQRTHMLLALKDVPYETININLKEKPEWLREKHPDETVPVLEKDDIHVYGSLIVAEYVHSTYLQSSLEPPDPYRKACDDMLITRYEKMFIPNYYKICTSKGSDTEGPKALTAALKELEDELSKRKTKGISPFFGGKEPAYVDYMIWPWLEKLPALTMFSPEVTMTPFPLMSQWFKLMLQLPAVQRCAVRPEQYVEFWEKILAGDYTAFDLGLPDE